ncbi:latexin [Rhinophrynus dorsalis]
MEALNQSYAPVSRAATVAENCINYNLGTPHRLFNLQEVTEASREHTKNGNKYYLAFSIKDLLNDKPTVNCNAEVLYYNADQPIPPNVTFKLQTELQNYTEDKDNAFYNRMRSLEPLLDAQDIPDKFGNVAPEMEPVLNLALAACGYVKWQNSTEDTFHKMAVIKSVKQLKREDTALEFHFVMLIHDMVSQEIIPWQIDILWDPENGLKIENQVNLKLK